MIRCPRHAVRPVSIKHATGKQLMTAIPKPHEAPAQSVCVACGECAYVGSADNCDLHASSSAHLLNASGTLSLSLSQNAAPQQNRRPPPSPVDVLASAPLRRRCPERWLPQRSFSFHAQPPPPHQPWPSHPLLGCDSVVALCFFRASRWHAAGGLTPRCRALQHGA